MGGIFDNPVKLPIPFRYNGKGIVSAEYEPPTLGAIADTKRLAKQNIWRGVSAWIAGSVIAYITEDGERIDSPKDIKNATFYMSMQCASALAVIIAVAFNDDDSVEGIYVCPRCGQQQIAEWTEDFDTRDKISDLNIICMEEIQDSIIVDLDEPIIIKGKSAISKQEVQDSIKSLELRHPTIQDGINSMGKYGATDETRQQFAYYVEALLKLNGEEVSQKEKSDIGMKLFEKMKNKKDMKKFEDNFVKYGIDNKVTKTCGNCNKVWKEEVNTSSFFASALQSG